MYVDLLHEEVELEAEAQEQDSGTKTTRVSAAGDLTGTPFQVTRVGG